MPKRVEFRSMKEAARQMPELIKGDTRSVVAGFAQVALGDLAKTAKAKTPRGPGEAASRRVASGGSAAYGHMASRWFFAPGKSGGGKVPISMGQAPPFKLSGDSWRLVNDAAHARVIEMGRQESKPYAIEHKKSRKTRRPGRRRKGVSITKGKEFTRMLGSTMAPNGVLGPSISQQMASLDKLQARAIQKAGG